MRKLVILCVAAGLAGCSMLPKLHVGVAVSAVIPEEGTLENTYMVDGFARLDVAKLQVEGSVGWKTYDYTPEGFSEGELAQIPVAVTLRYMTGAGLVRFVSGLGVVWNVNDVDEISGLTLDDAVGYRVVLGADIKIIEDFRISVEGMYDVSEADIEGLASGDTIDTSGGTIRVAMAYNF